MFIFSIHANARLAFLTHNMLGFVWRLCRMMKWHRKLRRRDLTKNGSIHKFPYISIHLQNLSVFIMVLPYTCN